MKLSVKTLCLSNTVQRFCSSVDEKLTWPFWAQRRHKLTLRCDLKVIGDWRDLQCCAGYPCFCTVSCICKEIYIYSPDHIVHCRLHSSKNIERGQFKLFWVSDILQVAHKIQTSRFSDSNLLFHQNKSEFDSQCSITMYNNEQIHVTRE